jgi:Mg/Co/Ni transporter MgtE
VVARTKAAGWEECVVVNEHDVVQGRLRLREVDGDSSELVESVMQPGPGTVRADADRDEIVDKMRTEDIPVVIVTTPDGELIGALRRPS